MQIKVVEKKWLEFKPENERDVFDLGVMLAKRGGKIEIHEPESKVDNYKIYLAALIDILKDLNAPVI